MNLNFNNGEKEIKQNFKNLNGYSMPEEVL